MFKKLIVYRIDPAWRCSLQDALEQAVQAAPFYLAAATQAESAGWVPPRGQAHGALVESVGDSGSCVTSRRADCCLPVWCSSVYRKNARPLSVSLGANPVKKSSVT